MTATGRRAGVRRPEDHYVTPDWCVKRLLETYQPKASSLGRTWLDPCAADGELIVAACDAMEALGAAGAPNRFMACDKREACREPLEKLVGRDNVVIDDFLGLAEVSREQMADVILTNPPFSLAQQFVNSGLKLAEVAIFLLRMNFLATKGRRMFMADHRPGIFVMPDRPSFNGYGTDAADYAWFVFGDPEVAGTWQVLNLTSRAEKRAWGNRARAQHDELKLSGVVDGVKSGGVVSAVKKESAAVEVAQQMAA
jgi:hypothetical protein